jgi:Lon protease-like protein
MAGGTRTTIPIFPLADVVLFPKLRVPLRIFEPRYRQMTRAALGAGGQIGMVTVRPEHIQQSDADPPVFAIGCEGRIIHSELLDDGRYNIVLMGTRRIRICREVPPDGERLYRLAEVEYLAESPSGVMDVAADDAEGDDDGIARGNILGLLRELVDHERDDDERTEITAELFDGFDDELFVNSLAQSLAFSASEKQGLIECDGIRERLDQLLALLQFRLAAIRSGQSGGARMQ